jgi:PleD family two-component response regulator
MVLIVTPLVVLSSENVASLVARADHALYRAKRYGRNRVEAA